MRYIKPYKILERKGNYNLFHKTNNLIEILKSGFIKAGGGNDKEASLWCDTVIRRNVINNKKYDKKLPLTISATRNLDYLHLPALELDVEKLSDRYKIIPYSENPDFYLDFHDNKFKKCKSKNFKSRLGRELRSKSKGAGKDYWRVKTDKSHMDYGISEEIILTDKIDVSKYVKRIILNRRSWDDNQYIIDIIKKKYPHIEVVEIDKTSKIGYADVKKELKKEKEKELVITNENVKTYEQNNINLTDMYNILNNAVKKLLNHAIGNHININSNHNEISYQSILPKKYIIALGLIDNNTIIDVSIWKDISSSNHDFNNVVKYILDVFNNNHEKHISGRNFKMVAYFYIKSERILTNILKELTPEKYDIVQNANKYNL